MKNVQNLDGIIFHSIHRNIGQAGNHKLARVFFPSDAAQPWRESQ